MKGKKCNTDLEKKLTSTLQDFLDKDKVTVDEVAQGFADSKKDQDKIFIVIFNNDQAKILKYEEIAEFVGKLYLTGDQYVVYELGKKMRIKFKTPEVEFIVPEDEHGF